MKPWALFFPFPFVEHGEVDKNSICFPTPRRVKLRPWILFFHQSPRDMPSIKANELEVSEGGLMQKLYRWNPDVFKYPSMERKEMAIVLLMQVGRAKNPPIKKCDNHFLDTKPGHIIIKLENR